MRVAEEPPACFLKATFAKRNIEVRHTSCLKVVALMDGSDERVPGPEPTWVVAQYAFGASAVIPKVKRHRKSTDATINLHNRLTENLADVEESPYTQVAR